jgi:predicted RNA-binding Zn-ribbon protein involved in translation (DUF1610 family)
MNLDEVYRLSRAKELLDRGDDDSLLYCCLELRLCIELICYRRLAFYSEYLPPSAKRLWRAKEVLDALLELDPGASRDYSLASAMETPRGRQNPVHLGTYRAITKQFFADHYDRLSSFLHAPTIVEVQAGTQRDFIRLRLVAKKAISALEDMAGNIFQSARGPLIEFPCDSCGTKIGRRSERIKNGDTVRCLEKSCQAEYEVTFPTERQFLRKMVQVRFECPNCKGVSAYGRHVAAKKGAQLPCLHCSRLFGVEKVFVLVPLGDDGIAPRDAVSTEARDETPSDEFAK